MYEIEAKVRLSEADFKRLEDEIPRFAKKVKRVINKDTYYNQSIKDFSMRIRNQNGKDILNLKSKKRGGGIEMNREIELPIASASAFDKFLKKIGIPSTAKKEKTSEIYKTGKMQIELNHVKKLGYFLEIETIVKGRAEIPSVKKTLRELFRKLGFSLQDFEKKYYLELLGE